MYTNEYNKKRGESIKYTNNHAVILKLKPNDFQEQNLFSIKQKEREREACLLFVVQTLYFVNITLFHHAQTRFSLV